MVESLLLFKYVHLGNKAYKYLAFWGWADDNAGSNKIINRILSAVFINLLLLYTSWEI